MSNQIKIGCLYQYKDIDTRPLYSLDLHRCIKLLTNKPVVIVLSKYSNNINSRLYKIMDSYGVIGLIMMYEWEEINE